MSSRAARAAVLSLLVGSVSAASAACAGTAPGAMEGPDRSNPFVGAWYLEDWRSVSGDGEVTFPYGEEPSGQISYTASGRMSAHLQRLPRERAAGGPRRGGSPDPGQHFSYWGTYSIDEDAGTVTHHVLGSRAPSWVGTDQVRYYEFQGDDRLILSVRGSDEDPEQVASLTWVRVE